MPIRAFERDNGYFQMICAEHCAAILPAGLPVVSSKERQGLRKAELKQVLMQAERLVQSDTALRYPKWQGHYRAALLETNRNKLFIEVEAAEAAVLTRLQALPPETENLTERHQLTHAWNGLQMIKKRKLGFIE